MVLVGPDGFVAQYNNVRRRWSAEKVPVHCLVGGDVDGVCTLRVLLQVLRSDRIDPVVTPVNGPTDVLKALGDVPTEGGATVLLLNCGGAMRLEDYLVGEDVALILLDSHRPHHLQNVISPRVWVWQDGDIERHVRRCQDAARKRKRKARRRQRRPPRKRRRKRGGSADSDPSWDAEEEEEAADDLGSFSDEEDEESGDDDDDEDDDDDAADAAKMARLETHYYRGTWFGTPSCVLLQAVASLIMSSTPDDLVWLTAISVAHFFTSSKMSQAAYDKQIAELRLQIAKVNLVKPKTERLGDDGLEYNAYHSIRLEECRETHLFLLRHLSLWDALLLSSFVASRLQILNTEAGLNALRQMAYGRIGLKDVECQTEWATLASPARRDEILAELAGSFRRIGCGSFAFDGVVMRQGYSEGVSAVDMAYIAQALLAEPTPPRREEDGAEEGSAAAAGFLANFYNTFEALDYRKLSSVLRPSVQKARSAQAALMRQCAALLQKEYVRNMGFFSYAFVNEASTDLPFFVHPLSLASLARCVYDTLEEAARQQRGSRGGRAPPLILLALDKETDLYTVVPCVPGVGEEDQQNPFGNYLRQAMESVDVKLSTGTFLYSKHAQQSAAEAAAQQPAERGSCEVGFDFTTCMKVHKRDVRGVLDALTLLLHQQNGA